MRHPTRPRPALPAVLLLLSLLLGCADPVLRLADRVAVPLQDLARCETQKLQVAA